MHITNREDLRVGDVATFTYDGHEFTGPLWTEGDRSLYVGAALVRFAGGRWFGTYEFVSAVRETPSLPTEPGSVIYVTECRGERVDEPVLAVRTSDDEWVTFGHMFGDHNWYLPEHITEWLEAVVVPRGGAVS